MHSKANLWVVEKLHCLCELVIIHFRGMARLAGGLSAYSNSILLRRYMQFCSYSLVFRQCPIASKCLLCFSMA